MARRRQPLTITGAGIALALLAAALAPRASYAQTATPVALSTPAPGPGGGPGAKKNLKKPLGAPPATPAPTPNQELENVRKALEALTPEQRQQFRENLIKWMNLPA